MALPAEFATVTLAGKYVDLSGAAAVGTVTFTAPSMLTATTSDVMIVPKPFTVTLDGTGAFSVVLPATNDPDISPTFTYTVRESFTSPATGAGRTFNIIIPFNTVGTLQLADLTPAAALSEFTNYLLGANNLSDITDAATARDNLGLGTAALVPVETFYLHPTGRVMGYLGDSLMPTYSFDGVTTGLSTTSFFWAAILASTLGKAYTQGVAAGVGGETSTQIAARVTAITEASPKPTHCFVHAGANDLPAGGTSATVIANLTTIIEALRAAQIVPIVLTLIPSVNINTAAELDAAGRVNDWITALPQTLGVLSVDWRAAVVDWSSSTGAWTSAWTSDGVHPNDAGHAVLADYLASRIGYLFADGRYGFVADGNTTTTGLLSPNPGMTGSSGTVGGSATGTAPTGWTVGTASYSSPVTSTTVARTDGVGGYWLSLTPSGAETGNGIILFYQNTDVGSDWDVGDTVWAEAEVYIPEAVTTARSLILMLGFWNGIGTTNDQSMHLAPSKSLVLPGRSEPYVLRTLQTVVPASTARLQLSLVLTTSATQVTGTVFLGRVAIRKVV